MFFGEGFGFVFLPDLGVLGGGFGFAWRVRGKGISGDEGELEAAGRAVNAVKHDVHALAKLEDAAGVGTDNGAVGIAEDEAVGVAEGEGAGEGFDGDKALDEEVVELYEEAIPGAGKDGRVELLADTTPA